MTVTASPVPPASRRDRAGGEIPLASLAVLLVAAAMDLIGMTVATMALPTIGRDLDAGPAAMEWIIAGYGLSFALLLVTGGRLGDAFGRRRILLLGLGGFTITSALCGLAPSSPVLVMARVAQGAFAALMVPQVLATIAATFPTGARAKAFGLFGATAGLAAVVGPLLGGFILEASDLGWRAIFLVNVPLGACTLLAARRWVTESRSPHRPPLDLIGVALLTAALAMILVPLIEGHQRGWPATLVLMLVCSAPALALFAAQQRHRERGSTPLIPTVLFRRRSFVAGAVAALMFFSGPPALLFVTANSLQALGHDPLTTALAFVPLSVASVPTAVVSAALVERLGRQVTIGGALLTVAGVAMALAAVHDAGAELNGRHLLPGLVVAGLGLGLVAPTLIGVVLSDIDEADAGAASGVLNTVLQVGGALGIALVGLIYFGSLPTAPAPAGGQDTAAALINGLGYILGVITLSALAMLALPATRRKSEPAIARHQPSARPGEATTTKGSKR